MFFLRKKINNGSLIELKTYGKLFLTFYQCTLINSYCLVPISFLVLQGRCWFLKWIKNFNLGTIKERVQYSQKAVVHFNSIICLLINYSFIHSFLKTHTTTHKNTGVTGRYKSFLIHLRQGGLH